MSSAVERADHLERELTPEPLVGPAMGSLVLHGSLVGALLFYGVIGGLLHSNVWGNKGAGGAMQVNLVSDALPLPNNQPVNKNVLTTEKPSQAPAPPAPKTEKVVDEKAIPILGKPEKPKEQTEQKTQTHQPVPQDNHAQYGEQTGSIIPRNTQPQTASNGPTAVGDADFASMFGWYVDQINRKMGTTWNRTETDPRTPKGSRVFLVFTVHRDGSPTDARLDRSSGSPTLDRSCLRAVQRVDSFGQLPAGYRQNTLMVSYYCEY